jgi:hypothetical protein
MPPVGEPTPPSAPVGGLGVSPQPPRDELDIPPGLQPGRG